MAETLRAGEGARPGLDVRKRETQLLLHSVMLPARDIEAAAEWMVGAIMKVREGPMPD